MPRVGSDEITIKNISDGDSSRTVYLFQNGTSSPTVPLNTAGFVASTGVASSTGSWSTIATVPASGSTLYVASLSLRQPNSTGNWEAVGNWEANPASSSGADGSPAPRFVSRRLYASSSTGTPGAPSAILTWSTLALSSITAGTPSATWSETAPTAIATSTTLVYFSDLLFIDVTGIATTSSNTGSTPKEGISFSGLVTFNNGDFALDGTAITSIDGGNITTGSISGSPSGVNPPSAGSAPTGTEDGTSLNLTDGNLTIGNSTNYISWDGTELKVQGEIVNITKPNLAGLAGDWFCISDTVTDLSTVLPFSLNGAGLYRMIMVGGGGGASAAYKNIFGRRGVSGGGAGALAVWTFLWNGTSAIRANIGSGGAGTIHTTDGNSGGASSFMVGGVATITTNGGGGGDRGDSILTPGGSGGDILFATNPDPGMYDLETRYGGRGGNSTVSGGSTSHGSAGGGGVNFLGVGNSTDQTITRGGDFVAATSNDSAATAGGGPQGKGGDISSMGGDRFSTAAVYAAQGSSSVSSTNAGITSEPVVGNEITTPYLGFAPLGRTYAGTTDDEGVGPPDASGILGGGGVLRTTVGTTAQASKQSHAPSGFLFGGGGGGSAVAQLGNEDLAEITGGNGGIGAGGGGGFGLTSRGGNGGGGALFVLRL